MAYTYYDAEHGTANYVRKFTSLDLTVNFHFHNAYELVYVREGEMTIVVDSRTRKLQPGDACLLFPGQIHRMHTGAGAVSDHLIFSSDIASRYHEKHRGTIPKTTYYRVEDHALVGRLLGEYTDDLLFLSDLYRFLSMFDAGRRFKNEIRPSTSFAMRVLKYVEEHYKESISLAALAAHLGYDYNYLSGCISDTFHTGFLRIVNEFRIGHACHLLRTTEMTASEISDACGYDCMRSFNRNFRQFVGVTPTAYRSGNGEKEAPEIEE